MAEFQTILAALLSPDNDTRANAEVRTFPANLASYLASYISHGSQSQALSFQLARV